MPSEAPILQKPKITFRNIHAVFSTIVENHVSLLKATSGMHRLATQEHGINETS